MCTRELKYAKDLNKNACVCKNVGVPALDSRAAPLSLVGRRDDGGYSFESDNTD